MVVHYGYYTKREGSMAVDRNGHPIVCHSDSECTSQLRILRAASTHFPVLSEVHNTIGSHKHVLDIDKALRTGDYRALMDLTNIDRVESLLHSDVDTKYEHCMGSPSVTREPDLENKLVITYSALITMIFQSIHVVLVRGFIKESLYQ